MMVSAELAQDGVLSDPTNFAEYLTFVVKEHPDQQTVADALAQVTNVEKSIRQKDTTARLSVTVGFSTDAFATLFPDAETPKGLHDFVERRDGPRHFPSTQGGVFIMIKSQRIDLNYQAAKYLRNALAPIAELVEDVQGFKYLDDRDMIDFVDGTENPNNADRAKAVLADYGAYPGASYLVVQRYTHRAGDWDGLRTSEQEDVIGRSKMNDLELSDDVKKPYAHNVKSKVEIDGEEVKMFRQNRAWGNALEHGTMFVGFAASLEVIETSLKQMITADEDGYYDKLLDFADARTGANYFVPPKEFIRNFS